MISAVLSLILLCICPEIASSVVYHITPPSVATPCPAEPCLTLTQFAANSSNHLHDDTVLLLQPGHYRLDPEIAIQNVNHFAMLSNNSETSTSTTIHCRWSARLAMAAVQSIHLKGLNFVGCYTHYIALINQFTVEDCSFHNHTGSALQVMDSTVYITGTSFTSNSFGSFHYGYISPVFKKKWVGGAISMTWCNITITESTLTDNHAEIGGAIYGDYYSNISIVNVTFEGNRANCSSVCNGGALYSEGGCHVTVVGSSFVGNVAAYGSVFAHTTTTLSIRQSLFKNNEAENGGVIFLWNDYRAEKGKLTVSESTFTNNSASNGGVLKSYNFMCSISHSHFENNSAKKGGGVVMALEAYYDVNNCTFFRNSAHLEGGVLITDHTEITFNGSTFFANLARLGGCLRILTSNISISNSQFIANAALFAGAVILLDKNKAEIVNSVLSMNTADDTGFGGVVYLMEGSIIIIRNVMITRNSAGDGILYLSESSGIFEGDNLIFGNIGSLSLYYGNVTFQGSTTIISSMSGSNDTGLKGGAITAYQSEVFFEGRSVLMLSHAMNGGAIHSTASRLYMRGSVLISSNTATDSGGGIYLYQSELNCISGSILELHGNRARGRGGGVHAIGSIISVEYRYLDVLKNYTGSRTNFIENTAGNAGGGIYFEANAKLNILMFTDYICDFPEIVVTFTANSADDGGAIYVADDTYPGVCASSSYNVQSTASECFCQTLILLNLISLINDHCVDIQFTHNVAHTSSSNILYGGLLDRCTVRAVGSVQGLVDSTTNGLTYFTLISNITNLASISSDPSQVCFCKYSQPDCSYQLPTIEVKKGERFTVSVVAVDHVYHTVSSTILSSLKSNDSGMAEGQLIRSIGEMCTDLNFNIFSPYDFEELIVYARGPCKDAELSQRRIQIKFLSCSCPIGFQPRVTEPTRCVCDCDSKLDSYITNCDPENGELLREGNFWITDVNSSNDSLGTYTYLIYPHCPLDYCHPPSSRIKINLNTPNGVDAQCANGHSGMLCGSCKSALSLSLGSTHCISCPSRWPAMLTISLIVAFFAGMLLVVMILALNLTVAVGTLNGIIFYANIINSDSSTFIPFKKPNFITVFISWLNLDVGFDICFYEGMDSYGKSLLQLAFPTYLIALVLVIIVISERSTKFAWLIGKKNPVATLATLTLLSYAKLLNLIIESLSFAILDYPSGVRKVVWLPDATIPYLKGKHVVLFIVAVLILAVGSIYTSLLFSWQWLLRHQDRKTFRWVRNQALYMFLEPYHAPYTFKHRYWTGLLLLVRAVVYIISAANVSNDPRVNLMATGAIITGLLVLKGYSQGSTVYRRQFIDILEMVCYVNIAMFCLAELFVLGGNGGVGAIAYVSGSITFILFLFVIIYHIYTELLLKSVLWKRVRQCRQRHGRYNVEDDIQENLLLAQSEVTHSEVPAPVRGELPLTALNADDGEHDEASDIATFAKHSKAEYEPEINAEEEKPDTGQS